MVKLSSEVDPELDQFPKTAKWERSVRRYHSMYQDQIDSLSYHLQRVQRYFLVMVNWCRTSATPVGSHEAYSDWTCWRGSRCWERLAVKNSTNTSKLIRIFENTSQVPSEPTIFPCPGLQLQWESDYLQQPQSSTHQSVTDCVKWHHYDRFLGNSHGLFVGLEDKRCKIWTND